jgi:glycosyltransferase involved in cell wall biosynthesis
MRLLVVTDHVFKHVNDHTFDDYCFDYEFFGDYRSVFENVQVVARIVDLSVVSSGLKRSDGPGVYFSGVRSIRGWRWPIVALSSRGQLRHVLSEADAVVVRLPSELGYAVAEMAASRGIPYMVEVIGDPLDAIASAGGSLLVKGFAALSSYRLKRICRSASVISYVNKSTLPRKYPSTDGVGVDYISSIRLPRSKLRTQREVKSINGKVKIAYVGTLTPRKRVADIMSACNRVALMGVDVHLAIVGDGEERIALSKIAQSCCSRFECTFHGQVSSTDRIFEILDDSELFVLASSSEGLPRAIIEAMARGLPVIGARAQGIVDLVRAEDTFGIGDIYSLSNMIYQISRDPERMSAMSEHSARTVLNYLQEDLGFRRKRLFSELRSIAAERIRET